jgi:hypothetical protein
MLKQQADELRSEETYQAWMSSLTGSLWTEEETREEGMRINGDSSPAFIQIFISCVHTYVLELCNGSRLIMRNRQCLRGIH